MKIHETELTYLWERVEQDLSNSIGVAEADFLMADPNKRSCSLQHNPNHALGIAPTISLMQLTALSVNIPLGDPPQLPPNRKRCEQRTRYVGNA